MYVTTTTMTWQSVSMMSDMPRSLSLLYTDLPNPARGIFEYKRTAYVYTLIAPQAALSLLAAASSQGDKQRSSEGPRRVDRQIQAGSLQPPHRCFPRGQNEANDRLMREYTGRGHNPGLTDGAL